jgi:hypothetical protein
VKSFLSSRRTKPLIFAYLTELRLRRSARICEPAGAMDQRLGGGRNDHYFSAIASVTLIRPAIMSCFARSTSSSTGWGIRLRL